MKYLKEILSVSLLLMLSYQSVNCQIGKRFPSEKKIIKDPVTGIELTFLTSTPVGDSKIYQTHNQWTSDGNWIIFRSNRVRNEAFAVNEKTGVIVQVSEGGYTGMLNIARKSMKLYFMRNLPAEPGTQRRGGGPVQVIEVDLAKLFADSESGKLKSAADYQRICGTTPAEMQAGGDMALDADEELVYFRVGKDEAKKHLPADTKISENFGPRNMGAGPAGIGSMNIKTGVTGFVVAVPFQIGHIQTNPWMPGEIVFCWETGGKAPQRTWTVMSDGSGLRPLYPESEYEWVTHEAVISKDEVAIAIMGHRKIGTPELPADPKNPNPRNDYCRSNTIRQRPLACERFFRRTLGCRR
jgi:oligogalacturonide lyase